MDVMTARATAAGRSVGCSGELPDQEDGDDQDEKQHQHGVHNVPKDAQRLIAVGRAERGLQQNDRGDSGSQRPHRRTPRVFDRFGAAASNSPTSSLAMATM